MALSKEIVGDNGVTTTYHRIVRISSIIDSSTTIEVASYVSEESRQAQLASEQIQTLSDRPQPQQYTKTTFHRVDYVDGMTCVEAYDRLKQIAEFSGATDC